MKKCKVYKDGSHYIAIRPTMGYSGVRRKPPPEDPSAGGSAFRRAPAARLRALKAS